MNIQMQKLYLNKTAHYYLAYVIDWKIKFNEKIYLYNGNMH